MKNDKEFEMLLDEIPHATSLNLHPKKHLPVDVHSGDHDDSSTKSMIQRIHGMYGMYGDDPSSHYNHMCISPVTVSRVSLDSKGSSLSGGGFSSDDRSPTPPPCDDTMKSSTLPGNTHCPSGIWLESNFPDYAARKNANESLMEELGLFESLRRMNMRDDSSMIRGFQKDPYGLAFRTNGDNVEMKGPLENFGKSFSDYGGLQCSARTRPTSLDDDMKLAYNRECQMGNLLGSGLYPRHSDALFSHSGSFADPMNLPLPQTKEYVNNESLSNLQFRANSGFSRNYCHREIGVPNVTPSVIMPSNTDAFFYSQRGGMFSNGGSGILNSLGSAHLAHSKPPLPVENLLHYNHPMFYGRVGAQQNGWVPNLLPSMRSTRDIDAYNCEDSLIIQGKGLNYVINKGYDHSNGHRKSSLSSSNEVITGHLQERSLELDGRSHFVEIPAVNCENGRNPKDYFPLFQPPKYNSLGEIQGYIYFIAKDQHGCRFLQRKFDEGTPQDVQMIFNEIIDHVVELMMNPFGNYLMQKLLDVCNEEQRMLILLMVTEVRGQLVKISLNTHGTRAVQKLIETLKTRQQISLVISALEPGFLDLIKDLNGNHVVQRCLQCLSTEDNKFIFESAARYCVDIATHRHGCCVLQRCIAHSTGGHRENLVAEISANGLLLAEDSFGNYVIQYILELKIPSATAKLVSQFEGNYVHLSTQKFSSNVIEKCLKVFGEANRSRIIHEFLSSSQFEQLLHDPFANYVIQCALTVVKGSLHAEFVEAIRPYASILRTSPYCKRIFSRALLKK